MYKKDNYLTGAEKKLEMRRTTNSRNNLMRTFARFAYYIGGFDYSAHIKIFNFPFRTHDQTQLTKNQKISTQPNPIQPVGWPNPWTTLAEPSLIQWCTLPVCGFRQITDERSNRGLLHIVDAIEDIIYRDQSMPMPASFEARVFLPGAPRHRRSIVRSISIQKHTLHSYWLSTLFDRLVFYFWEKGPHTAIRRSFLALSAFVALDYARARLSYRRHRLSVRLSLRLSVCLSQASTMRRQMLIEARSLHIRVTQEL